MPKISFVVAVYNVAPYIEQCARSLFEQTLQDIEIIIVDDCTPDNSVELVQTLLESYPDRKSQVRFVHFESNQGVPQVRRAGVSEATGEYIQFIDGDDWVEVTMAEELYAKAVESNADVILCDYIENLSSGETVIYHTAPNGVIGDGENLRQEMLNQEVWPNVCFRLFRRTLFDNPDIVWPPQHMGEDLVLCSELVLLAHKFDYLPRPFYHYRCNPVSVSQKSGDEAILRRFNDFYQNSLTLFAFLEQQGVSDKYALGIVRVKMTVRNQLSKLLGEAKYRKLWKSAFPELNHIMFWGDKNHRSSLRNKVWYILVSLGLYNRLSNMVHNDTLRRIIKSRPKF